MNLSNLQHKDNPGSKIIKHAYLTGLKAGAGFSYFFSDRFGLSSGLYYSGKGWKTKIPNTNLDTEVVRLNYVEIPCKFIYKAEQENGNWFSAACGFYFAYGFNGKYKTKGLPTIDPFKDWVLKRFDFGYETEFLYGIKNKYAAKINFSHGLISMIDKDENLKNYLFNFSFLFVFK